MNKNIAEKQITELNAHMKLLGSNRGLRFAREKRYKSAVLDVSSVFLLGSCKKILIKRKLFIQYPKASKITKLQNFNY